MGYNGKWLDSFKVRKYDGEKHNLKNKIVLETPCIEYYFTHEQLNEFKEKVNSV
ncbi:TPA_asm: hypothetical protein CBHJFHIM_00026 [Methanobrevibacter gottschalkii virus vir075]|uniref:Uncharacterized protein n=1 Tax=Methanobrevibacter gottschalkii TaxID=190974 RepID=A0A1H7I8L7_9EURY|nr:hypothetical protein [Methanobrevibacter gottschalkii]SEK58182.1 hypothetical protein SAMN05216439_1160 [Methanobrevibacter gottschalkii]